MKEKVWDVVRERLLEKQQEARIIRRIVLVIVATVSLLVGITLVGGYLYISSALKPMDPENHNEVKVEIPIGSGVSTIGSILVEERIIKNATVFKYYVKFNNETGFQAGTYYLTPAMTLDTIVNSLKEGKVIKEVAFKITIPEGLQLDRIAEIIAGSTPYEIKEIEEKLQDEEWHKKLRGKYPDLITDETFSDEIKRPLEGYLYPATYSFYEEGPSIENILEKMITQTYKTLQVYEMERAEKGWSQHELLTLASLIEEEATDKVDREKISSVFYNRMDTGMPLQTDPTVLYALGTHKERTMYKDLEVESPYNTYKVKGLTPGPIANAGVLSIEAALFPEDTHYYYFLAAPNGSVYYSETLKEHNRKKAKYITNQPE
ncbi:endolytic transglycosylase MltG (plasmid) [Rossellomorea sp. AcN35-11]|nr:endolytic transglycosylase MltG [Rossellomorea aquimaris]WJV32074.1 endolytic transglycosylase MltG [Rossellomorea sp. AcN35-11]